MAGTPESNQQKPEEFIATSDQVLLRLRSGVEFYVKDAPIQKVDSPKRLPFESFTKAEMRRAISRLQETVGEIIDQEFGIEVDTIASSGYERNESASLHPNISKALSRFDARVLKVETMYPGNEEAKLRRIRQAIREKAQTLSRGAHMGDAGDIVNNRSEALCGRVEKYFKSQHQPIAS